ncbi:MAG: carbamoyltransferase HypF [Acetobacteraceae bacterium]
MEAAEIRVRGRVQGVGFRPTVWRLARELGLRGEVRNDAAGVLIRVAGRDGAIAALLERIARDPPPLARIERIERRPVGDIADAGFHIIDSAGGAACTEVAPDAGMCAACAREVADPRDRRHRYGFANCTHCGPRFSIVRGIPYDRAATAMAPFPLCDACRREYRDPSDRRFHAEAIACPACGPLARLVPPPCADDRRDAIAAAGAILLRGGIVAVKGLGGYQLACDATNSDAVVRLRAAKHRETKPFALMARDLAVVWRHCAVSTEEARLLEGSERPIVLLRADGHPLPPEVAPGLATLGFMLPTTPLHLLLLDGIDRPVVMTSGNLTDEPQIVDDAEALARLGPIADAVLTHDRAITTRIDDSVLAFVAGAPRVLRRARGLAPAALPLPPGFAGAPPLLAAGGEVKAAFCLVTDGTAILSQHIGDLDEARTFDEYRRGIAHYAALFDHRPVAVAIDAHPDYLSAKHARTMGLPVIEVQHHHAHVAACLAENGRALDAPPVLGVVLDGLGWGDDGTIWGGEFLLADYRAARRLARLKPVAMPGGAAAAREPWRNLHAHLLAAGLAPDPAHPLLEAMIRNGVNAPLASSCGRLFDAVAAALDICRDRQHHEGEAASRLEALAGTQGAHMQGTNSQGADVTDDSMSYRMAVARDDAGLACLDPRAMWQALLRDRREGIAPARIAARFHQGLAISVAAMVQALAHDAAFDTVALTGGCFQNALLFVQTERRLLAAGFAVVSHRSVPANDGGLALGQAEIAAARLMG